MARYRIPRRTGSGEDILDTGPMEQSLASLQAESAAQAERIAALEAQPAAKVSGGGGGGGSYEPLCAVATHAAAADPHSGYVLETAMAWTAETLTLPTSRTSHRQVVSAPTITPTSKVEVMLAPVEDTDENDPELLDLVVLHATPKPATGEIEFLITFSSATSGPIPILYRNF